ncbi:MAG TPA: cytochrome c3 family protein [Stenomitos sp.]
MSQLFPRYANTLARASIVAVVLGLVGLGVVGYGWVQSSYATGVATHVSQPVPFSHEHHVSGLGLDCRYCHTSVETSSFAGMPSTHTCMTCHSQIWKDSPTLAPVRESLTTGTPIVWNRVYRLADFAYFDHHAHVAKGVGCTTCHGAIERMPLTAAAHPMRMQWCLECHRSPERFLRPREEVFNVRWTPPHDQIEQGRRLMQAYGVPAHGLDNCSVCHR